MEEEDVKRNNVERNIDGVDIVRRKNKNTNS